MKNYMNEQHRNVRVISGIFFICFLVILYSLAQKNDYPWLDSYPVLKFIFAVIEIVGLGPLMSILIIDHYNWAIKTQDIPLLAISWFPAVLVLLGFFVIKSKKYIIPLILGFLLWPFVGFFWVAMGA